MYLQYRIESANGKSNLSRNHNNLFGMKAPYRLNSSNGKTSSGFATYSDWKLSVIDRLILDYYMGWNKLSRKEYLHKMRTVYCKNCKNYLDIK